jgi:transformer-2 protein
MNSRLYVGNLPPDVTEGDLRLLFSKVGAVTAVQLVLDPATHQSRGHAFVTMAAPELAAAALRDYHSYNLAGRYIVVTEARPAQELKGRMSEGFDLGRSMSFTPPSERPKSRRRPAVPPRRRSRGR